MLREPPVAGGHAPLGEGAAAVCAPCEAPLGRDFTTIAACVVISELRLPSFSCVRNSKRRLRRRESHDPVPRNNVSRYSFVFKSLPALRIVALPLRSRLPARSIVRAVHFGQGAKMSRAKVGVLAAFTIMLFLGLSQSLTPQFRGARDPGVRGGPDGAGDMLPNLTAEQQEMFTAGQADFSGGSRRGSRPALQFRELRRLSRAARGRRLEPGGQSALPRQRPRGSQVREQHHPVVHHEKRARPRSALPVQRRRLTRRRSPRALRDQRASRRGGLQHPSGELRDPSSKSQHHPPGPHARVRRRIDREHHRRRDHGQPGLELLGQEQPGHQRAPQSKRQRRAHRSCRAQPAATSSGPRRCGASASACSSCTTVAPTTSRWRSGRTRAAATRSSGRRRPTGSSTTTTG